MPLFRTVGIDSKKKSGQLQEILCPRCKEVLKPKQELSHYGDGVTTRIVEGEYECACGYSVEVKERFPVINRAQESERHI